MAFDYSKLRGRIKEKYGTQEEFSKQMGMSRTSLSLRLTDSIEFSQTEIMKACQRLEIKPEEIKDYFFTVKV